jgi:hypothetical protein
VRGQWGEQLVKLAIHELALFPQAADFIKKLGEVGTDLLRRATRCQGLLKQT